MKLRFSAKCQIWLTPKTYKYSKFVDHFLMGLVKHGTFVGFTDKGDEFDSPYRVIIQYRGKTVGVWIANRWYASLTSCVRINYLANERNGSVLALYGDTLWEDARPSRSVELAFWNWVAAHCDGNTRILTRFMR